MTSASDLNQRVRIERRVKVDNTRGEVTYTWEPVGTFWAQANPLRGRDFFAAAQTQSEITTRFRIRYRTGLDETMRVVWKGALYDIKGPPIEVDGAREWIDLMCKAGPQDGR
jgi:SPP1 family predicted phage head-tail adaptor